MKKFLVISLLILAALPAIAQGNFTETLSVTNSPTNIVVHSNTSFVVIRENSAAPTAVFSVTPAGAGAVAVNFPAGAAFVFTNGSSQWLSGQTIGTIQATTSGPFTFVLIEGNTNTSVPGTAGMSSGGNVGVSSPVDGSGFVNVDCKTGCAAGNANGQATMANSAPVVIASNQAAVSVTGAGPAAEGAAASGSPLQVGGKFETTPTTLTNGQQGALQEDSAQNLLVNLKTAIPAGANTIGNVGINSALPAGTNLLGKTVPATGCGATVFSQAWILVPSANTAVASSTTCVATMIFTNVTTSVATITVTDNQGSPVTAINAFPIQPGATVFWPMNGALFTSGIKWQSGTASAISGAILGYQ